VYPVDQTSSLTSECASMWGLVMWAAERHLTDVSVRKLLLSSDIYRPLDSSDVRHAPDRCSLIIPIDGTLFPHIYSPLNRANFPVQWARLQLGSSKADMTVLWSAFTGHSRITRTFKGMFTVFKEHLHLILRFQCHGSVFKLRSLITWQICCVTM